MHYHHALPRPPPAASSTNPSTGLYLEPQLHIPTPDESPLLVESTFTDNEPSGTEVGSAEGPCNPPSVEDDEPHTGNTPPQSRQAIEEQTTHFNLGSQLFPHLEHTNSRNNPQPRGSYQQRRPLHHIPNYCFGRVQGLIDTFIWVFFPAFGLPFPRSNTHCGMVRSYCQQFRRVAQSTSRARKEGISTEYLTGANANTDVLGQGTRSNALSYSLQHRHLGAIWKEIQSRIVAFPQFTGVRLYMGAKNLKLAYMHSDITQTLSDCGNQWNAAIDKRFLDPDCTFIDIGRQYTPQTGSAAESNILIWRRCCLRRLWRQRQAWSRQYNTAKPDGHNHSHQFYNLVKIPFDAAKQYPFKNPLLEKMALDPSYLTDCEKSTYGSYANQASLKLAYRLSKHRAFLQRILLHLAPSWTAAAAHHEEATPNREPPFFVIQPRTMAHFLHSHINRYCFLFDYINLRFSMSGIIAKEPLLWRDRWKQSRRTTPQNDQQQDVEVELEDIRDVHARMWQAHKWAQHYSVRERPINRRIWLEYLYSTVIELFQCDVWYEAVESLEWTTGSDLNEKAATKFSKTNPQSFVTMFLQDLFHDRRRSLSHTRPHLLTGNKIRSLDIWSLVCDLLGFDLHEGRLEPRNASKPLHIALLSGAALSL
ncbi:hypothetical protein DER45DRAFT_588433 [Fusarium avenaceum]|nr:hypothetical protein DER45DRAFT_588433 [Fusarium avenaceum]